MSLFVSDALAADATTATTATAELPPEVSPEKMVVDQFLLLGALFFIFYFVLLRPQQQRIKAHKALMGKLAKNQKVITNGGLIGTIVKFEGENVVVLQVAQDVKVRVSRVSISDVFTDAAAGDSANDN